MISLCGLKQDEAQVRSVLKAVRLVMGKHLRGGARDILQKCLAGSDSPCLLLFEVKSEEFRLF